MGIAKAMKAPGKGKDKKKSASKAASKAMSTSSNQDLLETLAEVRGGTEERLRFDDEFLELTKQTTELENNPALQEDEQAEYCHMNGAAFDDDKELCDSQQGALRDGALFGAMLALARAQPELIKDMITDNYDGTYDVELYIQEDFWSMKAEPIIVTIDASFPTEMGSIDPLYAQANPDQEEPELWAMLIEKAYAVHMGTWDKANDEQLENNSKVAGALAMLMGKREAEFDPSELGPAECVKLLQACEERGWPVTCQAKNLEDLEEGDQREADRKSVVSGHTYVGMGGNGNMSKVDLANPWGALHLTGLNAADFCKWFQKISVVKTEGNKDKHKRNKNAYA